VKLGLEIGSGFRPPVGVEQEHVEAKLFPGCPRDTGFGRNDELDCPVPRLTLFFFGAAKDIPEAAKTVTAGTACLRSGLQAKGQTGHCVSRRYGP